MEEARKAQEEFDRIMPMVNAAIAGIVHIFCRFIDEGVRSITKADQSELLALFPNVPDRILKILETMCIMKGISAEFMYPIY